MQRKILGLFIIMAAVVFLGCQNPTTTPDTAITLLSIPGVTAPVRDATPETTAIDTTQYTGIISWSPADSPFAASTVYTANIVLKPKAGWTLTGVAENSFTVAGATTVTNVVNSGTIAAVFPATGQTITLLAIPGVTAPVRGSTPVTTAIDTTQYTGVITWSPTDSLFAASKVYTANIVLTAKAGWTLTGVAANSFTVTGATVTNTVHSGTVTAVFPATVPSDYISTYIGTLKGVPAGTFQRDGMATNTSTVSAFRMSACDITRAQFAAIMVTDPSETMSSTGMSDPVQMTDWYHAIAFCNKLSIAEGLTRMYDVSGIADDAAWTALSYASIPIAIDATWDAATVTWTNTGYRLPTEMEWMWAAMGATNDRSNGYTGTGINTTGYTKGYAGSTEASGAQVNIGNYAWYDGNVTDNKSHPVGGKLPNELGLYDMNGNVWEWNWDWYETYPTGTLTDYRGAASGTLRVWRGGSWSMYASSCTVAYRVRNDPPHQSASIGFRVVRR